MSDSFSVPPAFFLDPAAAARSLRRLADLPAAGAAFARLAPAWLAACAACASPDRALVNFERLAQAVADPAGLCARLAADPREAERLATLFAGSQFLTEILLRDPDGLADLLKFDGGGHSKLAPQFYVEAQAAAGPAWSAQAGDALRQYQRRELLRIGAGDLFGQLDLASVTSQLSGLAAGVIRAALEGLAAEAGMDLDGFCVLALGKLGGGELNYSSDVDLSFVVAGDSERFERLSRRLITALTQATVEGFLYRVDMRLRPWGGVGPLVATVDGYLAYLERHARLWEKQALLRAAPIAGDETLGRRFLLEGQPLIFLAGPEVARGDVYAMKQQTEAHLRGQGRDWGEVKLGEGSIRDVEFTAQYLQLAHGRALPALRTPNTLDALAQLAGLGCLAPDEQRVLAEGYVFLRTVEHALQILDYRQTHTLPRDAADLRYLAQRLGFAGPDAEAHFVARFEQHRRAVRSVYLRHLAGTADLPATPGGHAMNHPPPAPADLPPSSGQETVAVQSHRSRLPAAYAAAFSPAEIARHAALADRLSPAHVVEVVADLLGDDLWRVTVIGYDYLGELSLICGLLFVHGFSITDGYAFTYEPGEGGPRKIVDVFTVCALLSSECAPEPWRCYTADLVALLGDLAERRQREAQGELAKRVADTLRRTPGAATALHPIEITVDNLASDRYTVLRIEGQDTPGFLYEFTNALALDGVHIAQVEIATVGARVQDTLYVSDSRGRKITDPERERALRAATALVKHFTHLLPASPNPESALIHFHEYLGELFGRPSWPDELAAIERPAVLQALARLLGVSDFLWDDFLRMQYANLSPLVRDVEGLAAPRTRGALSAELAGLLAAAVDAAGRREALNAFKDREMFRVDMRHILGLLPDFGRFSAELTDLVETVVAAAAEMVHAELVAQHGAPLGPDGQPVPLVVCVLGKCGGYELGFASDIEVMFVYAGPGETAGLRSFSAAEFFDKLVAEFARAIWARRAGIFEIDLDLRPYGKAGSLSVSLDAFRRYFGADGPAWAYERQTLIKLRAIAGDADLGREVEALRDACVYTPAAFDLPALRAMRERQLRHLVTPPLVNVKYSLGGLVDVEYVVQGLQMRHGATHPGVRLTNTRAAIAALAGHGLISGEAAARLTEAHLFLQGLINALRVVRGNSKDLHAPADDGEDFLFLARRLGYGEEPARLRADLAEHLAAVQRLGKWLLG